jgi:hypothetical protein
VVGKALFHLRPRLGRKKAYALIDQGKNEQAVGLLTTSLEKDPQEPAALALRGLAFWARTVRHKPTSKRRCESGPITR